MHLTCCFTGQWVKVLLPEKWSGFVRDGSLELDSLRSDEERLHSIDNAWNCAVLCCWKMWVPTSSKEYPGLWVCFLDMFFTDQLPLNIFGVHDHGHKIHSDHKHVSAIILTESDSLPAVRRACVLSVLPSSFCFLFL